MKILFSIWCLFSLSITAFAQDEIAHQLEQKEKELTYAINREYAQYAQDNRQLIPILKGFKSYFRIVTYDDKYFFTVEPSQETAAYPALREVMNKGLNLDKSRIDMLMRDPNYRKIIASQPSKAQFKEEFARIQDQKVQSNPAYRELVAEYSLEMRRALPQCLLIITKDYETQGIQMPTDWIPSDALTKMSKTKSVKKLRKEIDVLRKQVEVK